MSALSSASFKRLVSALKKSNKTCTVVEQCCGGLINASIMAQPGASSVFFGGSVAYNTKKAKKLLLDDDELHKRLLAASSKQNMTRSGSSSGSSEADTYIGSKLDWTAQTSVAFCEALETDFCIAEGGAAGPTFRPEGLETGFAAIAVAGRGPDGNVKLLKQLVVRSTHSDRQANMSLFADAAADLASEVLGAEMPLATKKMYPPSSALILDRATNLRSDPVALEAMRPQSKYVVLRGNQILVRSVTELALLTNDEVSTIEGKQEITFLGVLSDDTKTPMFGIDLLDVDKHETLDFEGTMFVETRTSAPLFPTLENELALHACALAQWQRRSGFCSLCGGPMILVDGGTCRKCTSCGTPSWPRQDPSMIAVISSRDGQRILLARSPRHPPKLHTTLAGFVEVGETFEAAVAREAFEETGVIVDEGSTKYIGSQPWPFPQSCMIGFLATADDTTPLNIDTKELVSAQWFDKDQVRAATTVPGATMQHAVAEATLNANPDLPLLLPPKGVIARKLIDTWLEQQ